MTATPRDPILQARGVAVHYPVRAGPARWLKAVDGVDLELWPGETLGLVGESGSGKSSLARALIGLRPLTAGTVQVLGRPLANLDAAGLKALRREVQLVFQDPYAALNPRERVGAAVRSGLDVQGIGTPAEREARVAELLRLVGLSPDLAGRWPHEISGGQRQRVVIARALAPGPRLLVCDEPVSALDVSVQAQVLNLLRDLQQRLGLTMLFVSHNLAVVDHMADRVAVMRAGRIVELAERDALFKAPQHPYTRQLIDAVPVPDPRRRLQTRAEPSIRT